MYKYIFGPVYSNRFGLSLGVDLLGAKICSMNCPYCEIGKTRTLTMKRKPYVRARDVIAELSEFLSQSPPPFDCISFSGRGEPLLNSEIAQVIDFLKTHYPYKVVVLTNASHLQFQDVRDDIQGVDVLMPSLDAVSSKAFAEVNVPHHGLCVEDILEGIRAVKEEFRGELWIEILFVSGVNDSEEEVERLKQHVVCIQPHRVYVNTVYRPPRSSKALPISAERVAQLQEEFSGLLVGAPAYARGSSGHFDRGRMRERLAMVLQVRPSTYEDLKKIFAVSNAEEELQFREVFERFLVEECPSVEDFQSRHYYCMRAQSRQNTV